MTNKLKYFIGNWKMFGDFNSFKIIKTINKHYKRISKKGKNYKIVICVPNLLINFYKKKLKSSNIILGAQNCSAYENYGPHTGSISACMLKKAGAKYIILGHSENRRDGETAQLIKKKILSSLKENLTVIFCIGETFSEKRKGKTFSVLTRQIVHSIDKKFNLNKIIIAYEPVWSIGTGKIPKVNDLKKTLLNIKSIFKKKFKTKKFPIILYGGSVNDKNIKNFSNIDEIDGFLIGGASQSPKKFIDIIKNYYK